ncbi:MAG: PASTA domain-containing protein [Oscillospiraceae bacterium]|jgi:stage V sporulation protein D (sporulation-specific penicillin-binding protein)|nr:PASTA domain-containing protein [Oscillospiraceae bacterium]
MKNALKQDKTVKPGRTVLVRTWLLLALCGFVAFGALVYKLFEIQIRDVETYTRLAINQQTRSTKITASRGTIYDAKGKILAQSATAYRVVVSPAEMITNKEDPKLIAETLAGIWGDKGADFPTIMSKWNNTKSWHEVVAQKLEPDVAALVRNYKAENKLKSVHLIEESKRYYPAGNIASQIIGFVGDENKGMYGIESYYESTLRGVAGRSIRATNAKGTDMLYMQYENYYDSAQGNSITLTVDATLQYYLEKHLSQAVIDNQIRNGAMGIMMDVNTGAILAAASVPDYDPNAYNTLNDSANSLLIGAIESGKNSGSIANLSLQEGVLGTLDESTKSLLGLTTSQGHTTWNGGAVDFTPEEADQLKLNAIRAQWKSREFADSYEPGSTFKIITLAAALDAGVISESESFYCGGSMNVLGRTTPLNCWKRTGHGSQMLEQAAQHSCNVAFVNIGLRVGADLFYDYIDAFGLKSKTGLDVTGEGSSIWWSDEIFKNPQNKSQLASASFGQTFNITPLQMITAVSAVANGGYLMKPYLVSSVSAPDGTQLKSTEPTVVRQVISEQTSIKCRQILESVVSGKDGTGKNARVAGYRIAGKTGTAEKVGQNSDEYVVSFVGFAPADNPRIAVLVLLDSPSRNSGIYISGGVMAAPAVGNIFADALPYLGVDPELQGDAASRSAVVPNVKTLSTTDAKQKFEDAGFTVRVFGEGSTAVDQAPFSNVLVDSGSQVIIYTEGFKPDQTIEVPNVFGMSYNSAKAALESMGLFIRAVGVNPSESSKIVVARQSFETGSEVAFGTVVEVTLIDNDTSVMEGGRN